jgi:hypothetical protein
LSIGPSIRDPSAAGDLQSIFQELGVWPPGVPTFVMQDLGASAHYAYLGLDILGYVADDSVMVVAAVMALSSRKLTVNAGRSLKLLSGVVMLSLGAVIVFRPEWLM